MADLAVIGIGVDTTDLQGGKVALNQFAATGAETEKAVKDSMKGVGDAVKGAAFAAKDGAADFMAALQSERDAFYQLKSAIGPALVETRSFESVVEQLTRQVKIGAITQQEANAVMMRTEEVYTRARLGLDGVGVSVKKSSPGLRNFALQLGQVGQQGAVTGNYMQALAVQLPDMALGFGTVGALIGVAASALTPLIMGMASGADSAEVLEDAIDGLNDSLKEYRRAVDQAEFDSLIDTFGAITPEIIAMARELQQLRIREIMLDAAEATRALSEQFQAGFFSTAEQQIKSALGVTIEQAERLEFLFRQIGNADTLEDQLVALDNMQAGILEAVGGIENMDASQLEFYNSTLDAERALRAAQAAAGDVAGAMSGAADEAGRFADNAIAALNAANAQAAKDELVYGGRGADPRLFEEGGSRTGSGGQFTPTRAGAGSGGGSRLADEFTQRLERLQDELRTEREILDEWYEEGQDILADRRAREILSEEEHKAALIALEEEYHTRLADIRATSNEGALGAAENFFGEMAGVFQMGGARMLKISKVFGAAEAFISTLRGAAKALELPFPANLAAYAKVLATGMGLVSAIKGVSAGGGSSSPVGGGATAGASSAAAPAPSNSTYLNFSFTGGMTSPEEVGRFMVESINRAIEGGAQIRGVRIA